MTATMTACRAHSSSLAVPVTQNTAPIVEYRCLYTHDLRKKQKKWQDGFLRFHTFNKRVMVYDVPRNFVGDTHWRQSDPVQDGDEFELDRGALVQVGEEVATVEQDISGLLEKRAKAPEIPVPREPQRPANVHDVVNERQHQDHSQVLRSKSLNAVLGISSGTVGRAQLPIKSPHDLRIDAARPSWQQERPAKRQRVQTDIQTNDTTPSVGSKTVLRARAGEPQIGVLQDTPTKVSTSHPRRDIQPLSRNETVKDLCATPRVIEASESARKPIKSRSHQIGQRGNHESHLPKPNQVEHVSLLSSLEAEKSSLHGMPKSKGDPRRSLKHATELDTQKSAVQSPIRSDQAKTMREKKKRNNDRQGSASKPAKAHSRLQMASRKPRRKLMYRDLLPQEQSPRSQECNVSLPSSRRFDTITHDVRHLPKPRVITSEKEIGSSIKGNLEGADREGTRAVGDLSGSDMLPEVEEVIPQDHEVPLKPPNHSVLEIPKAIPKQHSTDDVLSKMDEILLSNPTLSKKAPPSVPQPANAINTYYQARDPTRQDTIKLPEKQASNSASSETNTRSPANQEPAGGPVIDRLVPAQPTEAPVPEPSLDSISIPSSQPSQPSPPPSPLPVIPAQKTNPPPETSLTTAPAPKPTTSAPPARPSPIGAPNIAEGDLTLAPRAPLPTFKPPTLRSPLKKSTSDLSNTRPLPPYPTTRPGITVSKAVVSFGSDSGGAGAGGGGKNTAMPAVDPWSREIWDLMGVGRDGVACSYTEFLEKMGKGKEG